MRWTLAIAGVLAMPFAAQAAELERWTQSAPPSFTLQNSTDGANVALASKSGQTVLVHFFATWCEPCKEELPALNRLSQRATDKLKIVAISVAEPDLRVRRFLETMPLNFPVLMDRDRAVAKSWSIATLPSTVVLDGNLKPRLLVESDFNWDTLDPEKLVVMTTSEQPMIRNVARATTIRTQEIKRKGG